MNRNRKILNKLKAKQEYYVNKISENRKKIEELQSNSENLEKFAREQYLMKKKNEDVYVIIKE